MKKNKKRLIELVCLVAVVAIVCCIPAFARTAKGTYLTEAEIKERKAFLTETGVPDDVLAQLSVGQMDTVYRSLEDGMEYFYYESRESYATEFKDSVVVEPTEQQSPMMTISLLMFKKTENGEDYYAMFPTFRWNEETQLTGDGFDVWIEGGLLGIVDHEIKYQLWDVESDMYLQECDPTLVIQGYLVTIDWHRSVDSKYVFEGIGYMRAKELGEVSDVCISLGYASSTPAGGYASTGPQAAFYKDENGHLMVGPVQEGNARYCLEVFQFSLE